MADKKFKTGVDLQSTVKISSETSERAMVLDASGNLVSSATTDTEIGYVSGLTSSAQTQLTSAQGDATQALSDAGDAQTTADAAIPTAQKAAANGVATLDANSKIPSAQLPAIAITDVFPVADITARDALTIGTGDGEVQEGDVAVVTDASADAGITAGAASYIYSGSAWLLLKSGDEVLSVNSQTGAVSLDADDISDAATTNKFVTAGDITNLGNLSGTNSGDEAAASTTVAGISEIATSAEIDTGTDDTRTISPLGLAGSQIQTDVSANNSKVSADGLVTTHSDVSDAGSGAIITGTERTKLNGIEASATADQTGAEIKSAYEGESDTNAYDDAAVSKLGGIEESADVTDAANVASAGATMNSDASLAGNSYFLDEDDMNSDSATQVPSQQSVKAYVDTQAASGGNLSSGDIKETSFSGAADTATTLDVTGLAFANGTVRSFDAHISVVVDAAADLYETFRLSGIQKGASWDMSVEATGDDSLVSFTITSAGQVQYSKTTTATWVSTTIKFRADTLGV